MAAFSTKDEDTNKVADTFQPLQESSSTEDDLGGMRKCKAKKEFTLSTVTVRRAGDGEQRAAHHGQGRVSLQGRQCVDRPRVSRETRDADRRAAKLKRKAKEQHDSRAQERPEFRSGDKVQVRHKVTRRWNLNAEIVEIGRRGQSYLVRSESNRLYWRHRKYLRGYCPRGEERSTSAGKAMKTICLEWC